MVGILKRCLLFFLIFYLLSSIFYLDVVAESLTVSINVKETTLTFLGKTSPNAQVTFMESGAVVGTTQADSNGDFSKSLTYLEGGTRTIGIYATDNSNRTTSTVSYSRSLTLGEDTAVSNVILPPTIALSSSSITIGDSLTISGEAAVSSTVSLVFSNSDTASAGSSATGAWSYTYNTGSLSAGSYTVYTKVSTSLGYQSESSETKSFSVNVAPTSAPGPTSTPGPAATSTPIPLLKRLLPTLRIFDINNSGKIELAELYEAIKKWVTLWRQKPLAVTCDLNHDAKCNLVDFSILMYYVGR